MSGHSHAKTIKRQKELADQKRGAIFSKMNRLITVAVRQGGPNPETNSKLKMAIDMAREFNMPKDNIERAIARGSGASGEGENFEEFLFEAYGPNNTTLLISGITDNRNRALGEVKQILNRYGGKMVGEGAIRWMFERKGIAAVDISNQNEDNFKEKENIELTAIESGASDIKWVESTLEIYSEPENLEKVKKELESKGLKVESVSVGWIAKEEVKVDEKTKDACEKLFEALDESDSVQEIYSNITD